MFARRDPVTACDVVVPVREGADHTRLRYALRSWSAHLPHVRVWVVGHLPSWVVNVRHLPMVESGSAEVDRWAAVRAACLEPAVSDRFLLCADDMCVMTAQAARREIPVVNGGLLRDVEEAGRVDGSHLARVRTTRQILERLGYVDPLSFEVNVPMPVDRDEMLRAVDVGTLLGIAHHTRTLYGNLAGLGSERAGGTTVDHHEPRYGTLIRSRFRHPCTYERTA